MDFSSLGGHADEFHLTLAKISFCPPDRISFDHFHEDDIAIMDKQKLISALADTQEDTILLAKIYDRLTAGERRNIPASTSFLTGREQLLAERMLQQAGVSGIHAFGGVVGAERQVLCYIPDYYEPEDFLLSEDGPVAALRAKISAYDHLEHRDFLGGILAEGIRREVLGDIFVREDGCDFLVLREMARYLQDNIASIGRARVTVTEIPLQEVVVPEQKTKVIKDTVASLRLDSVMASGFSMGRSKAQSYISAGKVQVDHLPVTKADREVSEGAVISARGLGKLKVTNVGGTTKKGRISVTLERYL